MVKILLKKIAIKYRVSNIQYYLVKMIVLLWINFFLSKLEEKNLGSYSQNVLGIPWPLILPIVRM